MADEAAVSPEPAEKLVLSDDHFLRIVGEQRRQSVGFGFANDAELAHDRERALNYYKGEMPDIPALENRSKAVSTDIAEAVETVLPDLVEMLCASDDVVTFQPSNEQDEEAAEQETDYVRHVFMQENPGFLTLTTAIKEALLIKVGVIKFWWEAGEEENEERFEGKSVIEYAAALQAAQAGDVEIEDVEEVPPENPLDQPTYNFTLKITRDIGCAKVMAVPSDDFTVSQDTVRLAEATYCAMKSRPRVQDLIAQGHDRAVVEDLPAYNGASADGQRDQITNLARDSAGEHTAGWRNETSHPGLRIVEVVEHYVRVDADDDGDVEIWKVVTGAGETVLISKERVDQIPFAAITPYMVAHRFYGRSVADVLIEIQKIKTALLRMLLDSGYFALNQRHEVAMEQANQWTLSDLMRNTPGSPIRSRSGTAVKPLASPGLSFDVQGALEYVSVMGEQRSGIKRHSMGLNPDTLHDTASGALSQLNESQKRMRFMGRVFAETGLKDVFLGLHNVIRTNARVAGTAKLRGKWVNIDPSQWGVRKSMTVEVGPARDHMLASLNMLANWIKEIVGLQGGLSGPLVTAQNVAKLLEKMADLGGIKGRYIASEQDVAAFMQQQAQKPPQPDPKMLEMQGKQQIAQLQAQTDQQRLQLEMRQQQLAEQQFAADQEAAATKAQADEAFRWAQLQQTAELALAQIQAEYKTTIDAAQIKAEAEQLRAGADMAIQAQKHTHGIVEAAHEAQHAADAIAMQHAHEHLSAIRDAALNPPPADDTASDSADGQ